MSDFRLIDSSHRVVVFAANPEAAESDFLEIECEAIRGFLVRSNENAPEVIPSRARSRKQLASDIAEFKPTIIHFTARGSPRNELVFTDNNGWLRKLRSRMLAKFLSDSQQRASCVIFSGCHIQGNLNVLRYVSDAAVQVFARNQSEDISSIVTRSVFERLSGGASYFDVFENLQNLLIERGVNEAFEIDYFESSSDGPVVREDAPMFSRALPGAGLGRDARDIEISFSEDLLAAVGAIGSEELSDTQDKLGSFKSTDAPLGPEGQGDSSAQQLVKKPKEGFLYRVWFGTNRFPVDIDDPKKGFGPERSEDVRYGYCDVAIPKYHEIGSVGAPWWRRGVKFWRNNELTIGELVPLLEGDYWARLKSRFNQLGADERTLLIFIHGYNVTFSGAAIRAAQLGVDLDVMCATAFFSWPSKGVVQGYVADSAAVEDSAQALGAFVVNMANNIGADRVHLIAHSMGNRGLLRAFTTIFAGISPQLRVPLRQLFLAAPDVDTGLFHQLASVYKSISNRTTMYVSGKDKALLSSGILHDYPRAGYSPPITIVGGVDTVEVSSIDLTFLGHGYFAEAVRVLQDMKVLMEADLPPNKRFGLTSCTDSANKSYWKMRS
jgi:esterase/lipase superfamily enzyme